MAHYRYSYLRGKDMMIHDHSRNYSSFNHAYDSADTCARFFARVDNGTITRTDNTITIDWNKDGDNYKIVYEIFP